MDWSALRSELMNDPLARGYAGMTADQVAADLHTAYRTRNRGALSGDEIFQQTDPTEFSALNDGSGNTADVKGQWMSFCSRASVDPWAVANEQYVVQVFGGASATVANLGNARVDNISRAQELGLGSVSGTDVKLARSL